MKEDSITLKNADRAELGSISASCSGGSGFTFGVELRPSRLVIFFSSVLPSNVVSRPQSLP